MHEQPMSQQDAQRAEETRRLMLRKILARPAMERLSRVKLVKPEVAGQLEEYLVSLYRAGKIKGEVGEEQIKMILETISGGRQFKIVRK